MITIQDLHFDRMEGQQHRSIIKGLHLTLEAGEQLALLGDSGAGKTTLLHIMAGMLPVERGKVEVNHTQLQHCSKTDLAMYRRSVGLIFQHYQLLEALNVSDNILFQWRLQAPTLSHSEMKTQLLSLAEQLGIAHRLSAHPHQLSGGEQQRVAIARALIHRPKVIFADEPTGNLDQVRSLEVVKLLTDLCTQQKINLVMVTHSQQLAQHFELIKEMKNGQLQCLN